MYADGNDLVERYDWDTVGDWATDDRETLARAEVVTHTNVLTALRGASGQIDAALSVHGKYSSEDLANLTESSASYLKDLVCDLAICRLARRRGESADADWLKDTRENALALLEALRNGQNIFAIPEAIDATLVDTGGPTPVDLRQRNAIAQRMMPRYFPPDETRLPLSQGGDRSYDDRKR